MNWAGESPGLRMTDAVLGSYQSLVGWLSTLHKTGLALDSS